MRPLEIDLLLLNGYVYPCDAAFSKMEAMAIHRGKVLQTGSSKELSAHYLARQSIDLRGAAVHPGFIDPHSHFPGYAETLSMADLRSCVSEEEVIGALKAHHQENPGFWITGRGWDQNLFPQKKWPGRKLLDSAFSENPVYLVRIDGHAAWVNSAALKFAKIQKPGLIPGGEILSDNSGLPSGILIDKAMELVAKHIPRLEGEALIPFLLKAEKNCFSVGLTMAADAGQDAEMITFLDDLHKSGKLRLRLYEMLNPGANNEKLFLEKGIYQTDRMRVSALKLFADGALGSRGAWLLEDYADQKGNQGIRLHADEELIAYGKKCLDYGFQLNVHAIGDAANRQVLRAMAKVLPEKNDLRWRIEHAQIVHPDDVSLFEQFSIIPSIQTTHCTSDMGWVENRLGEHRLKRAYAWRTLLNQNGWLPNGSDFPIEEINPMYGFHAAVTRQDADQNPPGGFFPEQKLTRKEALLAMTIWAAKGNGWEQETGSLETGKKADFILLDRDIMTCPEADLRNTRVLSTWMDGQCVFREKENVGVIF